MKRAICFCLIFTLLSSLSLYAQLPPEQAEKIERLSRDIESLLAANAELQKKIAHLNEELARVREEQSKSANDLAVQALREDLRKLAKTVEEVDRKRVDDKDIVITELEKIEKVLKSGISGSRPTSTPRPIDSGTASSRPETGIKYKIQPGDTLLAIIEDANRQFKDKGWKRITLQQVLDANPGLKPERMKVGDEVVLPIPGQ